MDWFREHKSITEVYMSLATTMEESKKQRRHYTLLALAARAIGNRKQMMTSLNLARIEVINQRYFLGPCPF